MYLWGHCSLSGMSVSYHIVQSTAPFPPQLDPHGAANVVNHQGPLGWRKAVFPVDETVAEGQMWLHGRDAGE